MKSPVVFGAKAPPKGARDEKSLLPKLSQAVTYSYKKHLPFLSKGVASITVAYSDKQNRGGAGCQQSTGLLTPRINYPSSSLQKALTTPRVKNLAVCSINRSKSTLEVSLAPSEITRTMTKGTPNS